MELTIAGTLQPLASWGTADLDWALKKRTEEDVTDRWGNCMAGPTGEKEDRQGDRGSVEGALPKEGWESPATGL